MNRAIILILFLLLFSACIKKDRWQLTIYPDGSDLTTYKHLGEYPTLESCRSVATSSITEKGDYECGLNCRPFKEDTFICKKTRH